jgi:hypothetical protein
MPIPGIKSAIVGAQSSPVVSLVGTTGSGAVSGGAVTFSSFNFGSFSGTFYLAITAESDADITAVTVGGVSASLVVAAGRSTNPTPDTQAAIYRIATGSGSKTIVISLASGNAGVSLFRVDGGNGTINDTESNNSGPGTLPSMSIAANSVSIAVTAQNTTTAITWNVGVTEVTDFSVGNDRQSAATRTDVTATSVVISTTAGINTSICAANIT